MTGNVRSARRGPETEGGQAKGGRRTKFQGVNSKNQPYWLRCRNYILMQFVKVCLRNCVLDLKHSHFRDVRTCRHRQLHYSRIHIQSILHLLLV
jgi:hypothetical protein